MVLRVSLLGTPHVDHGAAVAYRVRSRKSWALLAYLLLHDRPPSRSQLASLLYAEARDPLRALRWGLAELRRALGPGAVVGGDPVEVELPVDCVVDAHVVTRGTWAQALALPGLGEELLAGLTVRAAPAFSTWLLSEQRHLAAASEAILHEAAVGSASHDRLDEAIVHAARAAAMSPLDENHQALLIHLYRRSGAPEAAQRQHDAFVALLHDELGVRPGAAVGAALAQPPGGAGPDLGAAATVEALLEAGTAAIAAGAAQPGLASLRAAVHAADRDGSGHLRSAARLALAEALVHALGGLDEEGVASLHEVETIAGGLGDRATMALARAELGYVDFLRGRYDRAEHWLHRALEVADDDPAIAAKATVYLGCVASDRGAHRTALGLFHEAIELARTAGDPRREAFACSMIGRVHLLDGALEEAARWLQAAMALCHDDHWLAFLPWPQALLGGVQLREGELAVAAATSEQAFARARQLGDPCYEGLAGRAVAMAAEQAGDTHDAFEGLLDAMDRCNRVEDPYVWIEAFILDAMCELGRRHGHPDTAGWVARLRRLTARTGMRRLELRGLRHAAALGDAAAATAAAVLAEELTAEEAPEPSHAPSHGVV